MRARPAGLEAVEVTPVSRAQIPPDLMAQPEPDSDLPLYWIQLRNISLRLGQKTEFEMVVTEDAGDIASTSKVQVRP